MYIYNRSNRYHSRIYCPAFSHTKKVVYSKMQTLPLERWNQLQLREASKRSNAVSVYRVQDKDNCEYAIKIIDCATTNSDVELEILLHPRSNHQHLLHCIAAAPSDPAEQQADRKRQCEETSKQAQQQICVVVLPFYQWNLQEWAAQVTDLDIDIESIRCVFYQLCQSLIELHRLQYMHFDIKPENCLVSPNGGGKDQSMLKWKAVIGDYGNCRPFHTKQLARRNANVPLNDPFDAQVLTVYSAAYRPPECCLILRQPAGSVSSSVYRLGTASAAYYTVNSDVWALGKTFQDCAAPAGQYTLALQELLVAMLEPDSSKRIKDSELLNHPFFTAC